MKSKIILLNFMRYTSKKDNSPMTKVQFAFCDLQDANNYKGYTVIDQFYKGHEVYDKLNTNLLLKPLNCEFKLIEDFYNPLSTKKILKSIESINLI